jgi:hypothetical protein
MTVDYPARFYICGIIVVGVCLYLAVDWLDQIVASPSFANAPSWPQAEPLSEAD